MRLLLSRFLWGFMQRDGLVAGAAGDTVTAARLSDAVVDALAEGEQPHHLVQGKSLDVEADGDTERIYAAVDATAAAVATDRRLLFVVPEVVGTRTEAIGYGDLEGVSVSVRTPKELRVGGAAGDYCFNVSETEDPGTIGGFVEDRAAAGPEPAIRGGGGRIDDGGGRSAEVPTSDGGRTAGGRPDPSLPDAPVTDDAPTTDDPDPDSTTGSDGRSGASTRAEQSGAVEGPSGGDEAPSGATATPSDGGSETTATDDGPSGGEDPLDTLERLAELHERGVLDDDEFERKKTELLDEL